MRKLLKRRLTIYCYFNDHYGDGASESARVFSKMLARAIGKRIAGTARPASGPAQQTNLIWSNLLHRPPCNLRGGREGVRIGAKQATDIPCV
jgi:hypothetical protein